MRIADEETQQQATTESLTRRAFLLMRNDIVNGALEPGSKLKIETLRKRYNLGASPIREALSLLTSTAFVERLDQRGFRVSRISLNDFEELLWTRCKLESIALRESISKGDSDWEERVVLSDHRLSRAQRPLLETDDRTTAKWEDLHKNFHMTLLSACGSRYLMETCSELYDHNVRYRQTAQVPATSSRRDVTAEHAAIAAAALDQNAGKATALLEKHYRDTGAFLRQALDGQC